MKIFWLVLLFITRLSRCYTFWRPIIPSACKIKDRRYETWGFYLQRNMLTNFASHRYKIVNIIFNYLDYFWTTCCMMLTAGNNNHKAKICESFNLHVSCGWLIENLLFFSKMGLICVLLKIGQCKNFSVITKERSQTLRSL